MMTETKELPITVLMQFRSHSGEAMQKYILGYKLGHKTVDIAPVVWTPEEYQRVLAEARQVLEDYPAMKAKLIREIEDHERAKEEAEIRRREKAEAFWADRDKRIKADMARGPANYARHMRWLEANKEQLAKDMREVLDDLKKAKRQVALAEYKVLSTCKVLEKLMSGYGGVKERQLVKTLGITINRLDKIRDAAEDIEDGRNVW